jgi:carboxypeptidase PM20D1
MKRILLAIVGIVLVLVAVATVRAMRLRPSGGQVPAAAPFILDADSAARHLAGALQIPTVSLESGGPIDTAAFLRLHQYLARTYPLVHERLGHEIVGGLSLLYTWRGQDTTLAPIVLMAHQDVVPVTQETLARWTHQPFAGDVTEGFVWGRGALDDKACMVGILEATEALLRDGYQPRRTIYLAFGHDEEVGGVYGAKVIASTLAARGVTKPALVLDEGGALSDGLMGPGLIAIVGVAEKGFATLELKVEAKGGHSSVPPRETAIGILSRAITRLEDNPFPARFTPAVRSMFLAMAPSMPFGQRLALGNLWLFGPVVTRMMLREPQSASMLRTTTAPTVIRAGVKDNVLPQEATATVNFRILTGETVASVTDHVREIIADSRVTVTPKLTADPTPVSALSGAAFDLIGASAQQATGLSFPVAPFLVMGGTDAKWYTATSDRVYRFFPWKLAKDDFERVHGTDERIATANFAGGIRFYAQLLRNADKL